MSGQSDAEWKAELLERLLREFPVPPRVERPPKPKVVVEAGEVVRDADVVVSPRDPNARMKAVVGGQLVEVRVAEFLQGVITKAGAERSLGVEEYIDEAGRPQLEGFWSMRADGGTYYTKVRRDNDSVITDYDPFSDDRLKG